MHMPMPTPRYRRLHLAPPEAIASRLVLQAHRPTMAKCYRAWRSLTPHASHTCCFVPQYVDGDEELVKEVGSRTASFTPQTPEQIVQLQMLRRESTGKL